MQKRRNQVPESKRELKTWIISIITLFTTFVLLIVLEILFRNTDVIYLWFGIAIGIPFIWYVILVYFFLPTLGYKPLFTAIIIHITFLLIGVYFNNLEYYFFLVLINTGILALTKSFRQLFAYTIIGSILNILHLIFVIPHLDGVEGVTFFIQYMLSMLPIVLLLILTYRVMVKDGVSDRALEAFSSLLKTTPNYTIITDKNGKVRYLSDAMIEFTRFPLRELAVNRALLDLFPDEKLKLMFAEVLNSKGLFESVKTINTNDTERHMRIIADKLIGDTGGLGGMFIDLTDITLLEESKKAAEQARIYAEDARMQAEIANASKSKFLAAMSHEIRTPMNAILGITEMELESYDLPDSTKIGLHKIHTSGYILLGLINNILDLSKIETGNLELMPVDYDISSIISDTVHLNIVRIGSKPIKFMLNVCEHIPSRLIGDDLRIRQILNNIMSNAFKYTEEGKIVFDVKAEPIDEDNTTLIFTVSDTGQGMSESQLERLFDEYSRFNMNVNRTTEGAGLGMSIVRHLLDLMGGKIDVQSETNVGTVVTVIIEQKIMDKDPIGKELAYNLENFQYSADSQMKKKQVLREYMPYGKVLVVDDVETNLYVAKGLLIPYGLEIKTALSGFEVLDLVNSGEQFDIIFMDHMMPEMDGMETTKRLRDNGYTKPIVALTANAVIGQAQVFLENGFDDFIFKPIDIRILNAVLNKLIRDKQTAEVLEQAKKEKMDLYYEAMPDSHKSVVSDDDVVIDSKLLTIFARDAKKSISVLQSFLSNIKLASDEDLKLYITNVHAMKSSLANIGKFNASELAAVLEKAGKKNDRVTIRDETQKLIDILTEIVLTTESDDVIDDSDVVEDMALLVKELRELKVACENYDIDTSNAVLDRLGKLEWKAVTKEKFDLIAEHLLHSDFEKAEAVCEKMLEGME